MTPITVRTRDPAPANLARIGEFLGAATPGEWVDAALARLPDLLVDHANCEKKAAATAISLMTRYGDRPALAARMSRLAREELRHFEQVQKILLARGLARRRVRASRYAAGLHVAVGRKEPQRLVDLLVTGAFIEARSCERFALLAPRLEPPLADFYRGLLAAEARHFEQYLALAGHYRGDLTAAGLDARIDALRRVENALATEPDSELRFHSGPPADGAPAAAAQRGRASRL
jgi:tRNA-(ms[2]io[6]A)-hydroxylase